MYARAPCGGTGAKKITQFNTGEYRRGGSMEKGHVKKFQGQIAVYGPLGFDLSGKTGEGQRGGNQKP